MHGRSERCYDRPSVPGDCIPIRDELDSLSAVVALSAWRGGQKQDLGGRAVAVLAHAAAVAGVERGGEEAVAAPT
ncbi:hypothetical protein GUJ93_ZPchr0007g3977 [Zizania palustris]|uniref:Uncharacterized protein n=1 Tax=Zizania palustris TaxID=103762 RepID=A0A8J5VXQ6_ZIZPA|nr:hypothetical protein GUJ93_ZPchr0007g3977 [Zizania palustris]